MVAGPAKEAAKRVAHRHARQRCEGGFTYLGLIILVAIIGLVGAASLKVEALLRKAAAEEELLETGAAFSAALRSYADATPRGQPQQPPSLQALLRDPRYPGVRRHLRKIFVDPMTGTAEWGIIRAGVGNIGGVTGIVAVHSLSQAHPLKIANFDTRFPNFEDKKKISEWMFSATGMVLPPAATSGQVPAPAGSTRQNENGLGPIVY
jgi:type II secretory pathway pseudopilin PulG